MTAASPIAVGLQCPHCHLVLTPDSIRTGNVTCSYCHRPFLAAVFDPPRRKPRPVALVEAFPEGANACANHHGNAAITSCTRCGLFICSLCDLNLGDGSICPLCFDRVRADGALGGAATRSLDYASIARLSAIGGLLFSLFFLGVPIGGLAMYYARKGARQRKADGDSAAGMYVLMVIGALEIAAGLAMTGFIIWAMLKAPTS
jgi:hypothetical protein